MPGLVGIYSQGCAQLNDIRVRPKHRRYMMQINLGQKLDIVSKEKQILRPAAPGKAQTIYNPSSDPGILCICIRYIFAFAMWTGVIENIYLICRIRFGYLFIKPVRSRTATVIQDDATYFFWHSHQRIKVNVNFA